MEAVEKVCSLCNKKIVGMSEKHSQRLLRIHMYTVHQKVLEPQIPAEQQRLLQLFNSASEKRKQIALKILQGQVAAIDISKIVDDGTLSEIRMFTQQLGYNSVEEFLQDIINDSLLSFKKEMKTIRGR